MQLVRSANLKHSGATKAVNAVSQGSRGSQGSGENKGQTYKVEMCAERTLALFVCFACIVHIPCHKPASFLNSRMADN